VDVHHWHILGHDATALFTNY